MAVLLELLSFYRTLFERSCDAIKSDARKFRPYKSLPRDVPIMQRPKRHMPIGCVFIDIVVGLQVAQHDLYNAARGMKAAKDLVDNVHSLRMSPVYCNGYRPPSRTARAPQMLSSARSVALCTSSKATIQSSCAS